MKNSENNQIEIDWKKERKSGKISPPPPYKNINIYLFIYFIIQRLVEES